MLNLSKFLDREKLCRYISVTKIADYLEAKLAGNPYIKAFGVKRRKLPNDLQQRPHMYQDVELKKNQINEEEAEHIDDSSDIMTDPDV